MSAAVVAIDGPGGAGKSTVARRVAERLGFEYLDTGAMYRAVGLLASEAGVSLDDEDAVAGVAAAAKLRFSGGRLFAGDRDLSEAIRTLAMGETASRVSALPAVRRLLVAQQRALAREGGVVMEGRDIGTNVLPEAPLKVYLTADPRVRAERRRRELEAAGQSAGLEEVLAAVLERDRRDSTRAVAPLRKAADAVEVDTSSMTLDDVVSSVERLARERLCLGPGCDEGEPPRPRRTVPRLRGLPLRGHGDSGFYTFARWVVIAAFGLPYRVRARRTGHLPIEGPAIVVADHKSNIDPVMIGMVFDRPLRFMAKKELFRFAPLGWLVSTLGAFPVDRGAGDRHALEKALEVLAAGDVLLMFPEGTRFRDEDIHDFLPGVGMLAVRSGAPIIPMATRGTQYMVRDGKPHFPGVHMVVGEPIDLSDVSGRGSKVYQEVARRMRRAVEELYDELRG